MSTSTSSDQKTSSAIESAEFKAWFGDSKVVDGGGKPLVVYHGTPNSFDEFDVNTSVEGGFFFTVSPTHASAFASKWGDDEESPNIMPIYLSINQPLVINGDDLSRDHSLEDIENLILKAKESGNDGVVIKNFRDSQAGSADTYIAFSPNQIKSAIGNNGDYAIDNPDIRFSREQTQKTAEFKEWFGDSKIVDDQGAPLIVYHQTSKENESMILNEGFKTDFPRARSGDEQVPDGIFFKPEIGDIRVGSSNKSEIVQIQAYIAIKKPFVVSNRDQIESILNDNVYTELASQSRKISADLSAEWDEKWEELKTIEISKEDWENFSKPWEYRVKHDIDNAAGAARARMTKVLKERGYDGMIIENDVGSFNRSTRTIVALDPSQILQTSNPWITLKTENKIDLPEFKEWFGNSKIVDADGKPMVMYRGSSNKNGEAYKDGLIYLTHNKEFANHYVRDGKLFEFYVQAKAPFDASRGKGMQQWKEFIAEKNIPSYAYARSDRGALPIWQIEHQLRDWLDAKEIQYDAIYFAESDGTSSLAVRSTEQIKSAIDNPDIRFSAEPQLSSDATPASSLTPLNQMPSALRAMVDELESASVNDGDFKIEAATIIHDPALVTEEKTDTPEFKQWFGDSKVVGVDGKPLVVYHGTTTENIDIFYDGWWSESKQATREFGDVSYSAYLKIENPAYDDDLETLFEKFSGAPFDDEASNESLRDMAVSGGPFSRFLKESGYDGLATWDDSNAVAAMAYVPFSPNQIKSAIGNNGEYDPNNPDIRFSKETTSRAPQSWYYSQLARQIAQAPNKLDNSPATQWRAWLTGNAAKLGIKSDDIQWSGIVDYFDAMGNQKIKKSQIADFFSQNGVQIQEQMFDDEITAAKLNKMSRAELVDNYKKLFGEEPELFLEPLSDLEIKSLIGERVARKETLYSKYTLPGGKNYRELLLQLPYEKKKRKIARKPKIFQLPKSEDVAENFSVIDSKGVTLGTYGSWSEASDAADNFQETAKIANEIESAKNTKEFKSSHWKEMNVLAHVRFNERADTDGNKVLFVEELQSDWGQKGKRVGFLSNQSTLDLFFQSLRDEAKTLYLDDADTPEERAIGLQLGEKLSQNSSIDTIAKMLGKERELSEARSTGEIKVPSAPFVTDTKSWVSLGIKRMIRYAAENGFDKIAFISGTQSAQRYDMTKSVKSVEAVKKDDGNYYLIAHLEAGGSNYYDAVKPESIEEIVGKDLADKILHQPAGDAEYSGIDLKIGGDGMRAFYDNIVPQVANDVLKKLGCGSHLENIDISNGGVQQVGEKFEVTYKGEKKLFSNAIEAENYFHSFREPVMTQRGFAITPAMRELALSGLPMFKRVNAHETDAIAPAALAQETLPAVQKLAEFFKVKVGVLRQADDAKFKFRGLHHKGTIWLNESSSKPLHTIFGHELVHTMKYERPDLYQGLRDAVLPMIQGVSTYAALSGLVGRDDEYVVEEMVADLVGDRFAEKEFWSEVAAHDRSLFKDIGHYVTKKIDAFCSFFKGSDASLHSDRFVTNLGAARTAIAQAIAVYAQEKNNIQRKEKGFFESFKNPLKTWFAKEPTKEDFQKITNVLAENIDKSINDIYCSATGNAPNYVDVFNWLTHDVHHTAGSKKVTFDLIRAAIARGDATAKKYSGLASKEVDMPTSQINPTDRNKPTPSQDIGSP